jgi:hypothetical protein
MAKKESLVEKARLLYEQSDDATKNLEKEIRQEFLGYLKNLRQQQKMIVAKELLHKEIIITAQSIVEALVTDQSDLTAKPENRDIK